MNFCKAFDTIPRKRLFDRLKSLEIPHDIIWAICVLCEEVSSAYDVRAAYPTALLAPIGVKQGCPLSPAHFGNYIDEITDFIGRKGGNRIVIGGMPANDIVLWSEYDQQR